MSLLGYVLTERLPWLDESQPIGEPVEVIFKPRTRSNTLDSKAGEVTWAPVLELVCVNPSKPLPEIVSNEPSTISATDKETWERTLPIGKML